MTGLFEPSVSAEHFSILYQEVSSYAVTQATVAFLFSQSDDYLNKNAFVSCFLSLWVQ